MLVAGSPGASTGYRATLSRPVPASAVHLKIRGSANAAYYVNVYGPPGRKSFASGWIKSPPVATAVKLDFEARAVTRLEVYTKSSDGKTAENHLASLALSGAERKE